jgi:hypothetical protein
VTPPGACEGDLREDLDCDAFLDTRNEDRNGNGRLDQGEDLDFDGRLDLGFEDRNGNGILDDTPFPATLYPYGRLAPIQADRDYTVLQSRGIVTGPYYERFFDERSRLTLRQDLGVFIPDRRGNHDLKMGYVMERDAFDRSTDARDIRLERDAIEPECFINDEGEEECFGGQPPTVVALIPSERSIDADIEGTHLGMYVQELYKPTPNLSIGLGVRFDREKADTAGYSFFDPRIEAASQNRILALTGIERGGKDLSVGNADGVESKGILSDPLFSGAPSGDIHTATGFITDPLYVAALGRLTRHRSTIGFTLNQLGALFPDIVQGDELNVDLLAELGVRFQQQEQFTITNNNLAPRLSVAWDPFASGKTKVFATWGRYYDKLFLSTIVGEGDPERIARYYLQDPVGYETVFGSSPGPGGSARPVLGVVPNHNIGTLISKAPPSVTQVDRQLKTPFSDELTVGIEREIAPEMALSLRYIDRKFRDQLQDMDINHSLRFDPLTGEPVDRLGRLGSGDNDLIPGIPIPDGRPDLYLNNIFFNEVLRIGNFNEARYKAIEVAINKRMSRRWELQGSYTYSRAVGDAEEFQSRLGNDPSTLESEFGYLDFDQRHVVKLNGAVFLPGDWQLGFTSTWSSGLPYSIISRFFAVDNVSYEQFRTRYGFTTTDSQGRRFVSKPRNSERNHSVYDFNIRAKKSFVIGRSSAAVFVEVFNLLNSDDLRIFTFEPNKVAGGSVGNAAISSTAIQLDAERRFGRRFQVGFQFSF